MNVAEIARPWAKIAGVLEVGPIRDDGHYRRLSERLDVLVEVAAAEVGSPLWDLVELIGDRLREYEARAHPWGEVEPVEALRYLMQAHGLTQSDLPEVGNQGVVSEILAGNLELNVRQVRALGERFGVDPAVFL